MYLVKRVLKFIILIAIFIAVSVTTIEAQSGCCSWHGGVSHCASNGRKVCNDGTYSPSCTCTPTPTYKYNPPTPPMPDTQGNWEFKKNASGRVDLYFDWTRPDGNSYSITMNNVAGANPGPLADTAKSEYIFKNISPGTRYINLKENIGGQWSKIVYWKVEVPSNVSQIATPYSSSPVPSYQPRESSGSEQEGAMTPLLAVMLVAGVPGAIVYYGKNYKA